MSPAFEMTARRAAGFVLGSLAARTAISTRPLERARLLRSLDVGMLIDVGANIGQYAAQVRLYGYRGRILSLEPQAAAAARLRLRAAGDPDWTVRQLALGADRGRARLYVAANSQSSSLLPMLPLHAESAPGSFSIGYEEVEIDTLASILEALPGRDRAFLKIDAQGAEAQILASAGPLLDDVAGLELELSLAPLYAGESLFSEITEGLTRRGFSLVGITPGHRDPRTSAVLQVDALFRRVGR